MLFYLILQLNQLHLNENAYYNREQNTESDIWPVIASRRLVEKLAEQLELKVLRIASKIIMEGY